MERPVAFKDKILTVSEVSTMLGASSYGVKYLVRTGKLRSDKMVGNRYLFLESDVFDFLLKEKKDD